MGSITVIIIVFMFAIVGIKEFLIVLAVGGILGIISAIVQSAEQRRENKYKQYYDSNTNNQSYRNDKEQTDNTLVIDMMKQEEPEINDLKVDDSNWESDCESCEKLLEDCECDWQDISREDTSQSEWSDETQIVNDMILLDMMEQEERETNDLKIDSFNWESDCESCEELLEDCDCDWQDISREDTSQSEWNDKDSSKRGTSFDNFGG